jgi:hypothetical protein
VTDDEALLENLLRQVWAVCRSGADRDLGVEIARQIYVVCDRLPLQVARAALVRGGILDA